MPGALSLTLVVRRGPKPGSCSSPRPANRVQVGETKKGTLRQDQDEERVIARLENVEVPASCVEIPASTAVGVNG